MEKKEKWNKGLTKENNASLLKMSNSKKGKPSWNKGKVGEDSHWFGRNHTEKSKDKMKILATGRKHTEESKIKIGLAGRGRIISDESRAKRSVALKLAYKEGRKIFNKSLSHKGIKHSEATKNIIREKRKTQVMPIKDTSIEIKIQNFLIELNIPFLKHQYMEIEHGYQCDILVPSMNLVIEIDGDYWHCNTKVFHNPTEWQIKQRELDEIRGQELIDSGLKVLRLWECDIKIMDLDDFKDIIFKEVNK